MKIKDFIKNELIFIQKNSATPRRSGLFFEALKTNLGEFLDAELTQQRRDRILYTQHTFLYLGGNSVGIARDLARAIQKSIEQEDLA